VLISLTPVEEMKGNAVVLYEMGVEAVYLCTCPLLLTSKWCSVKIQEWGSRVVFFS